MYQEIKNISAINKNDDLFLKIWRNYYIRRIILFHLRLFNLLKNICNILPYDKIDTYKTDNPLVYYMTSFYLCRLYDMDCLVRLIESLPNNISGFTIDADKFKGDFNKPCLGSHIKNLSIYQGQSAENLVEDGFIPITLEKLHISEWGLNLPIGSNLKDLTFSRFSKIKFYPLPIALKQLRFNSSYCELPEQFIPPSVSLLEISRYDYIINSNIFQNPSSLEILKLRRFDQPLNTFSNFINLKELNLGINFNQIIEPGDLPLNLQVLEFGQEGAFNKPLKPKSLPDSLLKIVFNTIFDQDIHQDEISLLPPKLEILKFGGNFTRVIPEGILPNSIHTLYFVGRNNSNPTKITRKLLPTSITKLKVSKVQVIELNSIPNSIKSIKGMTLEQLSQIECINHDIKVGIGHWKHPLVLNEKVILSKHITSLTLETDFYSQISLRDTNIRHLKFGRLSSQLEDESFPIGLESLAFTDIYYYPFNPRLMQQLQRLKFGFGFKTQIPPNLLPSSITDLSLDKPFNHTISIDWLPKSIKKLTILSDEIDIQLPLPDQLESITISIRNEKILNNHLLVLNLSKILKTKDFVK